MHYTTIFVLIILICAIYSIFSHKEHFAQKNDAINTEIIIHKGDITKLDIECIVCASNERLSGCFVPGHCIDSAIHLAAGPLLLEECKTLNGVPTGEAKITKGYKLPAKYIIHTTGPQYIEGKSKGYEWNMLKKCYTNTLNLAKKHGIKEIAFCCISTGLYGYPKDKSAKLAYETITNWINEDKYKFDKIVFVVFSEEDNEIYKKLHSQ